VRARTLFDAKDPVVAQEVLARALARTLHLPELAGPPAAPGGRAAATPALSALRLHIRCIVLAVPAIVWQVGDAMKRTVPAKARFEEGRRVLRRVGGGGGYSLLGGATRRSGSG